MPGSIIFKWLRAGVNLCKPDQQNLSGALSPEEHRTYKGDGEGLVETISLAGVSGACAVACRLKAQPPCTKARKELCWRECPRGRPTSLSAPSPSVFSRSTFTFMHLADAFIQSDLQCIQAIQFFFISMCVPWESNPQPFALLTKCSTTEPQEHYSVPVRECPANRRRSEELSPVMLE